MKLKTLLHLGPELYQICAILYYWFLTSNVLNPFAIGLLIILMYQIIVKNATLGILISCLFILLNIFMVIALISELSEFQVKNNDYTKLLIIGSLFFGLNLIIATLMLRKYLKRKIVSVN